MAGIPRFSPRAIKQLHQLWREWQQTYRFGPDEMRWRGNAKPAIFKGKAANTITKGSSGPVEIWKGTNPDEEATGVIVTCMNYYHDIDQGRWCHFIRIRPDFGELIAGDVCD